MAKKADAQRRPCVDAHTHVVAPDRVQYPLNRVDHPGSDWVDLAPVSAAELVGLAAAAGVLRVVLVQPHGAYRDDNRYVLDAAAASDRLAAVVIIDPLGRGPVAVLRDAIQRGAAGVRLFSVPTPVPPWLNSGVTAEVIHQATDAGMAVAVCCLPAEVPAVATLANRHPSTDFVLDHCGFLAPDHEALSPLADCPNVTLKVTAHVLETSADPAGAVGAYAALVGEDRLIWGSDYAQIHDRPYASLVDLGRAAASALSERGQTKFLLETADRLFFK